MTKHIEASEIKKGEYFSPLGLELICLRVHNPIFKQHGSWTAINDCEYLSSHNVTTKFLTGNTYSMVCFVDGSLSKKGLELIDFVVTKADKPLTDPDTELVISTGPDNTINVGDVWSKKSHPDRLFTITEVKEVNGGARIIGLCSYNNIEYNFSLENFRKEVVAEYNPTEAKPALPTKVGDVWEHENRQSLYTITEIREGKDGIIRIVGLCSYHNKKFNDTVEAFGRDMKKYTLRVEKCPS